FTQAKQADQETAMRVTRDALAVDTPIWMLRDSAYDILDWHDHLLAAGVVPIAPYNPRTLL
ncbi:ISH11-type transposase ISHwa14, partial [Natrialba taiwanensis DSM 12281]